MKPVALTPYVTSEIDARDGEPVVVDADSVRLLEPGYPHRAPVRRRAACPPRAARVSERTAAIYVRDRDDASTVEAILDVLGDA